MTLTVHPDLEKKLAAIAGQRDPQAVLDEIVEGYVEDEADFMAAVQEGKDAAARGELIPHDEVFAKLEKKLLDKYGVRV
jgi:predicted transcriptional regulator